MDKLKALLRSYGGATLPTLDYPDSFLSTLLENGEFFIPNRPPHTVQRLSRRMSFSTQLEAIPGGTHCTVTLLQGPTGNCYHNAAAVHEETGYELVLGYGLTRGVWIAHGWCVDQEQVLYEATWPYAGQLYFGTRGFLET